MISIGIRFGKGFDRETLQKLIIKGTMEFEYDFVVIGTNPGGLACAKEASAAGKKVAIINWKSKTPAYEDSGLDGYPSFESVEEFSDFEQMKKKSVNIADGESYMGANVRKKLLEVDRNKTPSSTVKDGNVYRESSLDFNSKTSDNVEKSNSKDFKELKKMRDKSRMSDMNPPTKGDGVSERPYTPNNIEKKKYSKKMKKSKIDLKHAIQNLGAVGRKMMHCAALLKQRVADARGCGWKVIVAEPTLNWYKMNEHVLDYITLENWRLKNELRDKRIECIDGFCTFLDGHKLRIELTEGGEREITSALICVAVEANHKIRNDIPGAVEFGITPDDLIRLEEPPGKTLVVGGNDVGMECAGIIRGFDFEVKLIEEFEIMEGFDREMVGLILGDMKEKGVEVLENTKLISIEYREETNNLYVKYQRNEETGEKKEKEEGFDTVLFAVGTKVCTEDLSIRAAGVTPIPETEKIFAPYEQTEVPHIYAVGDVLHERPEHYAVAELAGKLLGRRIFVEETTHMDYDLIPIAIFTPVEYSFIGLSEDAAVKRFGPCIDVYKGHYQPLEYVLPERKTQCYLKVLVLDMNKWVIGMHLWGPDASEIIQGFVSAIKCGLTIDKLNTTVGIHTSKAENFTKLTKYTAP